jgi:dephospho-CoA kinase
MFAGKPIIGITGGIGSGKSFVANLFGEMGCLVINSDDQVHQVYRDPKVQNVLRQWWGPQIVKPDGEINRPAIARKVFADPQERQRLEQLLYPLVDQARQQVMEAATDDPQVLAFVWDTPLLCETGLDRKCDTIVYVDAPEDTRLSRVKQARGWDRPELESRENLQLPLDKKREISDYVISNTAGADQVRVQVREVLSRILAESPPTTGSQ